MPRVLFLNAFFNQIIDAIELEGFPIVARSANNSMELRQEETRQLFYWHENLKTTSISVSSLLICMGRRDQRIYSTKFEKLQIHKNLPAASAIPD